MSGMKLIDFDKQFMDYTSLWARQNAARFKDADEMEAHMPEMYMQWLNTPAGWLGGETPGMYFEKYDDADDLIRWAVAYEDGGVSVPDQLLERVRELDGQSVKPLMALAMDDKQASHVRVIAVNLLLEIGAKEPLSFCLDRIDGREKEDDLADACAELLEALGHDAVRPILNRLDAASDEAKETYLDLLCNFPGDERIYNYTMQGFWRAPDKRALYASYLAKLGDRRAEPELRKALSMADINYLDYLEIVNAIEALGGEEVPSGLRSFEGDPYYESMKRLE